ncbi:MAG: DUF4214 domain-containing protein [Limnohabitans sp.]
MAITKQMRTDVSQLYVSLFGRAPDAEGLSYWVGQLNAGKTLATVAQDMYNVDAARAYYPNYMTNEEIISSFYKNVLGRTGDAEGVQYWTKQLDSGTSKGKVFVDIMTATVKYSGTDAAALQSQAWFNGRVASAQAFGENNGTVANATIALNGWKAEAEKGVFVDAEAYAGISQYASVGSSSDLTLEDVRTVSYKTTVRMQSTDAAQTDRGTLSANNSVNGQTTSDDQIVTKDASDMVVLFAKEFIQAPGASASGASLRIDLADVLNLKANSNGLNSLPYDGFTITVGGKEVKLAIDFASLTATDEYGAFITAVNTALATAGYAGIKASALAQETVVFSKQVTSGGVTYAIGSDAGLMTPILLTNSGAETISMGNYSVKSGASAPNGNLVQTWTANPSASTPSLTQVNLTVDDVGRSCQGGDLIVGGMDDCGGIEQFNLTVERTSNLNELASTLNKLEVVNVVNGTTKGNLSIDVLKDVRVFDASKMEGAVDLKATLSSAVAAKYMSSTDSQANPAADNSDPQAYNSVASTKFLYNLAQTASKLDLSVAAANLNAAGATTREDFDLTVNGNGGNDQITVHTTQTNSGVTTPAASDGTNNWYQNSKLNANMAINAGAGDDVVKTPGAGDFKIDLGAGNDVAYTDNTGSMAKWVFNAKDLTNASLKDGDLASAANTDFGNLNGASLSVTFKGITATSAAIVNALVGNTQDSTTALEVNQLIKSVINSDATLSKLLIAQDGPANTLIVTSLIDGDQINVTSDLSIAMSAPSGASATVSANVTAFNAAVAYDGAFVKDALANNIAGTNAVFSTGDNKVTGGDGNDVIVLGTEINSNETVVYGANFGADVVVHFTAAGTGKDMLDFTAIGGKGAAAAGAAGHITVATADASNDTAAEVAALIGTNGGVFVAVSADNIGTVWQVTNGTTAATVGTIDLADTAWATLTAANFA